jgi:hypothetical protein
MLIRVLNMEARPLGVRVQMLTIARPVQTEENRECACPGWPGALAIAEQALALVDQTDPRHAAEALVRFTPASEMSARPANFDRRDRFSEARRP